MKPSALTHSSAILPILAKNLMAGRGDPYEAHAYAIETGAPQQVVNILRAAQAGANLGDPTFAGIVDMNIASAAYIEALRTSSVFLQLLDGGLVRAPLRTRVFISTFLLSGDEVNEGAAIPLSKLEFTNGVLAQHKAGAMITTTQEVARAITAAAQALVSRELRNAVSTALDAAFFSCIEDTSTAVIASDGTTALSAGADLKNLLDTIPVHTNSKLFFLAAPDVAIAAATLQDTAGNFVFPLMSPSGGMMLNVPVLVSESITGGNLWLIDGSGIAAGIEAVTVSGSRQATLQMDNAPTINTTTPVPAELVSLWQTNSVAAKAMAYFGCERVRANAVSRLESIAWGPGGAHMIAASKYVTPELLKTIGEFVAKQAAKAAADATAPLEKRIAVLEAELKAEKEKAAQPFRTRLNIVTGKRSA